MSKIAISQPRNLRRANDAAGPNGVKAPRLLFDEFVREGEVALLFGTHGVGKSLMAVELAEALARGRPMNGLEMPTKGQKVLYVDLVLSDDQFAYRYSYEGRKGRRLYKFSSNFYRDRPGEGKGLAEWLRAIVAKENIRIVIIDDLSVISQTNDGTRQTLELVRELRRMTHETGITAIILADSYPTAFDREIAERDLRRTRILCAHADSVFALSKPTKCSWYHLSQTRSQAGEIVWTERSPAHFKLAARDNGLIGFEYGETALSPEQERTIREIRRMRDVNRYTFREIAEALDLSKSSVQRYYHKWKPAMEPAAPATPPDEDDDIEYEYLDQDRYDDDGFEYGGDGGYYAPDGQEPGCPGEEPFEFDPLRIPFAAAFALRPIYDLERDVDHKGEEIFVEAREEISDRPRVWYKRDVRGNSFTRWERSHLGTQGTVHGPSPYLPRGHRIMTGGP